VHLLMIFVKLVGLFTIFGSSHTAYEKDKRRMNTTYKTYKHTKETKR
jgi:hypothetical protein